MKIRNARILIFQAEKGVKNRVSQIVHATDASSMVKLFCFEQKENLFGENFVICT